MDPIERRIRTPSDNSVFEAAQNAYPHKTAEEIIAELMRMIVIVAVCYNDVVEGGQDAYEVLQRRIFAECDELAESFPWPPD